MAISFIIFVTFIFIFFIASKMQGAISNPILQLAKATRGVSQTEDYSIELQKYSNDEIGQLFDGSTI